jgi:hypothetical protein
MIFRPTIYGTGLQLPQHWKLPEKLPVSPLASVTVTEIVCIAVPGHPMIAMPLLPPPDSGVGLH